MANYTDPTSRPVDPSVEQTAPASVRPCLIRASVRPCRPATSPTPTWIIPQPRGAASGTASRAPLGPRGGSTVDTAKGEAGNIKDTAAGAAADVKDVAKGEVSNVAGEAKYQARNLVDQTRSELRGQVGNQQSQLASRLNSWASELGSMASKSDDSGPMTDLAQEASRRAGEISHWLDNHEPADLLDEVRRFARRRPVAFFGFGSSRRRGGWPSDSWCCGREHQR